MKSLVTLLIACGASQPLVAEAEPPVAGLGLEDRCAMVEAALLVKDAGFRRFYQAQSCGEQRPAMQNGKRLVDVVYMDGKTKRALFGPGETCKSRAFAVYRDGAAPGANKALRLTIHPGDQESEWTFMASWFDPPGELEQIDYYCHAIGGMLKRSRAGWKASRSSKDPVDAK